MTKEPKVAALPRFLDSQLLGFFQGLCAASDVNYQEGGCNVSYKLSSQAPHPQRAEMKAYHDNWGRAEQSELPQAESDKFALFLTHMLGTDVAEAPANACQELAKNIVDCVRTDTNCTYIACEVDMDENGLSGSADLIAAGPKHRWFHIISFGWSTD